MTFEITHRFTRDTLFVCDVKNLKEAVEKAVSSGTNLEGVNLFYVDLTNAILEGANIPNANMVGADLPYTNLTGANMCGANLARANMPRVNLARAKLSDADLSGANMKGANLSGTNLSGANLSGANLSGANLSGANLSGANLDGETLFITPISINNLYWPVLITAEYMRIGCQRHKHEEWAAFGNDIINKMHRQALNFWALWKAPLMLMCDTHKLLANEVK